MSDPTLADLDRCPHGRHAGDACAGWKGPGDYDGGCRGGYSLGNPYLARGQRIGTALRGEPILAPAGCDAYDCTLTAHFEFTVGERPPGVEGLEGWPEGAPELADNEIRSGRVIRFCHRHAHQLRSAAGEQQITDLTRHVMPTVYGIRGHRIMTPAEHEQTHRLAEQYPAEHPLDPAVVEQLRAEDP